MIGDKQKVSVVLNRRDGEVEIDAIEISPDRLRLHDRFIIVTTDSAAIPPILTVNEDRNVFIKPKEEISAFGSTTNPCPVTRRIGFANESVELGGYILPKLNQVFYLNNTQAQRVADKAVMFELNRMGKLLLLLVPDEEEKPVVKESYAPVSIV